STRAPDAPGLHPRIARRRAGHHAGGERRRAGGPVAQAREGPVRPVSARAALYARPRPEVAREARHCRPALTVSPRLSTTPVPFFSRYRPEIDGIGGLSCGRGEVED